jgi:hypothetical protein
LTQASNASALLGKPDSSTSSYHAQSAWSSKHLESRGNCRILDGARQNQKRQTWLELNISTYENQLGSRIHAAKLAIQLVAIGDMDWKKLGIKARGWGLLGNPWSA